jgi:hypothetical protein
MLYLCGYTGAPVRPNKQHGFLRKTPKFCVFTFAVDWWVPFRPRHVTQLVGSKCESTCMLAVAAEHVVLFLPMISTCTKVCLLSLQSGAKANKDQRVLLSTIENHARPCVCLESLGH